MKWRQADDFEDDLYSFRVRREIQLATDSERQRERAYYEHLFGAGTLRLIRVVMIPVWVALAVFACAVAFALLTAVHQALF